MKNCCVYIILYIFYSTAIDQAIDASLCWFPLIITIYQLNNVYLLTGSTSDDLMNRMRKFVSPRFRHKVLDASNKTFGVPLDELVRQTPSDGDMVPTAVKKICEHIYKHGMKFKEILCFFFPWRKFLLLLLLCVCVLINKHSFEPFMWLDFFFFFTLEERTLQWWFHNFFIQIMVKLKGWWWWWWCQCSSSNIYYRNILRCSEFFYFIYWYTFFLGRVYTIFVNIAFLSVLPSLVK